jgi:hypothetical protein
MEEATQLRDDWSGCPGFFVDFSKSVKFTKRFFDGKGALDEFCIAIGERGRIRLKELFNGRDSSMEEETEETARLTFGFVNCWYVESSKR